MEMKIPELLVRVQQSAVLAPVGRGQAEFAQFPRCLADALFIRTGRWARRAAVGPFDTNRTGRRLGPNASMIPWLRQRDVALLGGDVPPSLAPSDVEGETGAVHDFALVYLGVHVFDNCDLEALAEAAAARKRWEFLLTVAPLAIRGGTGSPANPIATF